MTDVIRRYLDCGDLHFGFARVKCEDCGHEYSLAFSCKRRHFCPSCHQKRVVEFGEWLCEEVLKEGLENLARYIIRASFSQERMTYIAAITQISPDDTLPILCYAFY